MFLSWYVFVKQNIVLLACSFEHFFRILFFSFKSSFCCLVAQYSVAGSSFGTALTYPLCAFLIYHFGWESVFYVTSSLGLIWYFYHKSTSSYIKILVWKTPVLKSLQKLRKWSKCNCIFRYGCWYFLVYDSPSQHPRISPEEKQFILQELTNSVTSHPSKVPWKDIFCSVPFWATFYTQFSVLWGLFTFITQSPTYFHFVHGWEINTVNWNLQLKKSFK